MIKCQEFIGHEPELVGKRNKYDNTIYTFDIETTSYIILDGKIYPAIDYLKFNDEEQKRCEFRSTMYEWSFSINDKVYYGRTWGELKRFLMSLEYYNKYKKIVFVHNLSFEFQFLKTQFKFDKVFARKAHKPIKAEMSEYNIEFRCSYIMSNCKLAVLPKVFNLPVEKRVGDLDYSKLRHSGTELSEKELEYCEYDCLVVYEYIKMELETYERVNKIPITSTGHVRRELKELIEKDWTYKNKVRKSINVDPHVYNLLIEAFAGGYTHSNWIYTDEILENIDSWDFTSSYPYILVTHKFPATEFKKCEIKSVEDMSNKFAYLMVVEFEEIESKYFNNFISQSKCRSVINGAFDNGRIMKADKITIALTDIDFYFLLESYKFKKYTIIESYYSRYDYLPKKFIEFVLEKYVNKTKYKNVEGMEVEYSKEKNKFNSLYGMSVTNMIKDEVIYDNIMDWSEEELTNEEIEKKLEDEKKKAFLSFSYGVWVTAYARSNLLKNMIKLDKWTVYSDTDSLKLLKGYDKKVIEDYNSFVERKIKRVSEVLGIPIEKFAPKDSKGEKHMLGVFDFDGHYEEFITQGAKKYAYTKWIKNEKVKKSMNIIKEENGKSLVLEITVAGVPKERS